MRADEKYDCEQLRDYYRRGGKDGLASIQRAMGWGLNHAVKIRDMVKDEN